MAKLSWATLGQWALEAVELAPEIISQVEAVQGESKSGVAKTQIAANALVAATNTAELVAPQDTEAVQGISALAGAIIAAVKTPSPVAPTGTS